MAELACLKDGESAGGWTKIVDLTQTFREMIQFAAKIVQAGGEKPPSR